MGIAIPTLFLKWLAFRELLRPPQSNAEIGTRIWGPDDGPSRFSKLLRGDYGCEPDVAAVLAEVINKRIATVRSLAGLAPPPPQPLRPADFELPVFDFVRGMVTAIGTVDADALDRTHRALLKEFEPDAAEATTRHLHLAIDQFAATRFFEDVVAAESGPPVFEIGRHKGLFAIEGLNPEDLARPMAAYAFFARDPATTGARLWDMPFNDVVRWLPSPFTPTVTGGRVMLMSEPKSVLPLPGRFRTTVVLVFDRAVLPRLDPRGKAPSPGPLNEEQTVRFLVNLHRVAKSHGSAISLCGGDYIVRQPKAA